MPYSISQLERLSGIKAHTIRIWEQRYNLLKPSRTDTNIRYYDDNELRKLLNISLLIEKGQKIGLLSKLSPDELKTQINSLLTKDIEPQLEYKILVNRLISAALSYDQVLFQTCFSNCLLRFGMEQTYKNIILPLLGSIGIMWGKKEMTVGQEHFISGLIVQKLHAAIEALPLRSNANKKWILFLPEKEQHEIGLLLSYYLLKKNGVEVIYMGKNVPFNSLVHAVEHCSPQKILFFISGHRSLKEANKLFSKLKLEIPKSINILCSGNPALFNQLSFSGNIKYLNSLESFHHHLETGSTL